MSCFSAHGRVSFVSVLLCVCLALAVLPLASCEKEMPKRLDGMYASDGAAADGSSQQPDVSDEMTDADGAQPAAETFDGPRFQSGSYVMTASSVNEYKIYEGKSVVSYDKSSQIYTYGIKLTAQKSGAMKAVYTFRRIVLGYETQDGAQTADTSDKKGKNEYTAVYYDLIGQSFTVEIAGDGTLSVKGIDALHEKIPDSATVVTEDNMREMAGDLFYPLDSRLQVGSSWQLTQGGIVNTYRVASRNDKQMFVDIAGGQLTLPEPYTQNDITYTYTSCDPLSGTLTVERSDRMIQEQSSYQEMKGTLQYGSRKLTFVRSVSSNAQIQRAGGK